MLLIIASNMTNKLKRRMSLEAPHWHSSVPKLLCLAIIDSHMSLILQ